MFRFAVGQRLIVASRLNPQWNGQIIVVRDRRIWPHEDVGNAYKTDIQHDAEGWFREESLKEIPDSFEPSEFSFAELIEDLNKELVV
jgi:hypothetical protein